MGQSAAAFGSLMMLLLYEDGAYVFGSLKLCNQRRRAPSAEQIIEAVP
jgi:hypothetical protein